MQNFWARSRKVFGMDKIIPLIFDSYVIPRLGTLGLLQNFRMSELPVIMNLIDCKNSDSKTVCGAYSPSYCADSNQ